MTKRRIFSLTILKNDVRKISGVFLKTMSLTLTSIDHFMTPNDCLHKQMPFSLSNVFPQISELHSQNSIHHHDSGETAEV